MSPNLINVNAVWFCDEEPFIVQLLKSAVVNFTLKFDVLVTSTKDCIEVVNFILLLEALPPLFIIIVSKLLPSLETLVINCASASLATLSKNTIEVIMYIPVDGNVNIPELTVIPVPIGENVASSTLSKLEVMSAFVLDMSEDNLYWSAIVIPAVKLVAPVPPLPVASVPVTLVAKFID